MAPRRAPARQRPNPVPPLSLPSLSLSRWLARSPSHSLSAEGKNQQKWGRKSAVRAPTIGCDAPPSRPASRCAPLPLSPSPSPSLSLSLWPARAPFPSRRLRARGAPAVGRLLQGRFHAPFTSAASGLVKRCQPAASQTCQPPRQGPRVNMNLSTIALRRWGGGGGWCVGGVPAPDAASRPLFRG